MRVQDNEVLADFEPAKGFSGGPVFDENEKFVGMVVGCADGYDLGSPTRHKRARIIPFSRLDLLTD